MSAPRTLLASVIFPALNPIVQLVLTILKSRVTRMHILMLKTTLCVGLFSLVAMGPLQCQQAGSTTPENAKKEAPAADKKDKPTDAKKNTDTSKPGGSPDSPAGSEGGKVEVTRVDLSHPLGNGRLDSIASDFANVSLTPCTTYDPDTLILKCEGKGFPAKVSDLGLRSRVKEFRVGDIVRVEINDKGELQDLRGSLSTPNDLISHGERFLVLTGCALVILGLAAAVTKGSPFQFIIGADNRYSNSKFQLALWFWVVLSSYLAVIVFRVWYAGWDFLGGVNIPQNLLVLSGLSVITYGGAKAITTSKEPLKNSPIHRRSG